MRLPTVRSCWIVATLALAAAAPLTVDPPDIQLNMATGLIDTVDAAWSGSNFNVRFTEVTVAGQQSSSFLLTSNAANDLDPRIACNENGDLVVVWWRDLNTDTLIYRKRSLLSGAWSLEKPLGMGNESSSHPRVLYAGAKAWVAYQFQKNGSRAVGAQIIDDDAEPTRSIVATTTNSGDLDIQINYEAGHLWITWIDSATRVGYSEYNQTTHLWPPVAVESYASDSVAAARDRIRSRILGQ